MWLAKVGNEAIDEKKSIRLAAHKKLKETQQRLYENVSKRGVDKEGFIRVLYAGDDALFANTDLHEKYMIASEENPEDYMNNLLLKGKDFAAELSNHHIKQKDLKGEQEVSDEHRAQNKAIREHLPNQQITPEELPPEESIEKLKKLNRRKDE